MVTIQKDSAVQSALMELYADLHVVEDRLAVFSRMYGVSLEDFEVKAKSSNEDFDSWDSLMEWKGYEASRLDVSNKISEVETGAFTIA